MNDNFDVSQLRWWRCVAVDHSDKIQTFVVKIGPDNVYIEFNKIRHNLHSKGLRFVEAKPITEEEVLAAEKLMHLKAQRRERLRGLTGRAYSPASRWKVALFVVLLILPFLWLVCRH